MLQTSRGSFLYTRVRVVLVALLISTRRITGNVKHVGQTFKIFPEKITEDYICLTTPYICFIYLHYSVSNTNKRECVERVPWALSVRNGCISRGDPTATFCVTNLCWRWFAPHYARWQQPFLNFYKLCVCMEDHKRRCRCRSEVSQEL